jgi:hypothetical protein
VASNATRSEHPAKNEQSEYATFETALKRVLSVPSSVMKKTLKAEKKSRKASSRASGEKD